MELGRANIRMTSSDLVRRSPKLVPQRFISTIVNQFIEAESPLV